MFAEGLGCGSSPFAFGVRFWGVARTRCEDLPMEMVWIRYNRFLRFAAE